MTTNAWGVKLPTASGGAWADEVDHAEQQGDTLGATGAGDFPSLTEASKKQPEKKKKGQKLALGDFLGSAGSGGGAFRPSAAPSRGQSDREILLSLPTASSGIKPEGDERGGLGGAFREYDDRQRGGFRGREDRPRRGEEDMMPSRADEAGDWGANRKFAPTEGPRGGFGGGRGGFDREPRGDREPRDASAADTVDDWGTTKKFEPSAGPSRGGFADRPDRGGFKDRPARDIGPSRADEGDWGQRSFQPSGPRPDRPDRPERDAVADQQDNWRRGDAPSTSGTTSERPERPRLNLAPRTKPIENPPPPKQGSENGDAQPAAEQAPPPGPPKPKSNPFGAARPREEILKEKGVDYVKEELKLEHGEVIREETPEEKAMQEELKQLQAELEKLTTEGQDTASLKLQVDEKERALYKLQSAQAELDDKVKYSHGKPDRRERPEGSRERPEGGKERPEGGRERPEGRDREFRRPEGRADDFPDRRGDKGERHDRDRAPPRGPDRPDRPRW